MNAHAPKSTNSQSISAANASGQSKVEKETGIQVQDLRPGAVAQRELQELTNNSQQVKQLKAIQQMADNRKYSSSTHIQHQPENALLVSQNAVPVQLVNENGGTTGETTNGNGNSNTAGSNATATTAPQRQGNSFAQHLQNAGTAAQNAMSRDINELSKEELIQWLNTYLTAVIQLPGIAPYNDEEAESLIVRKWPYVVVNRVKCELWINYHFVGSYIGPGSVYLRPGGSSKISTADLDRGVVSEIDTRMRELMPQFILDRINGPNTAGGGAASVSNNANTNANTTAGTGSSNSPAYRPGAFGRANQVNQAASLSNNANTNANATAGTGSSNSPAYRPGAFGRANQANQAASNQTASNQPKNPAIIDDNA